MPRSPSPRRDRERDYDRTRERPRSRSPPPRRDDERSATRRSRSRSRSPPRPKRTKELSFYKKSSSSSSSSYPGGRYEPEEESARERIERRERGEVPARFGGTREQGVRNTMGNVHVPATSGGVGSFSRGRDPLDRIPARGGERDAPAPPRPAGGTSAPPQRAAPAAANTMMIEVIANDRMGRKVRIKCLPTDTVGDLKRLIAAQTGTTAGKIQLKKWYTQFKDHVSLQDYEINDGMSLEMY